MNETAQRKLALGDKAAPLFSASPERPVHPDPHPVPTPQVRDMAKKAGAAGVNLLVIDTENKFVSTGFAEEIAKAGSGKYYYLPNASDAAIAMAASSAMAAAKAG